MATDITTLAIALQSREAEMRLKVFNELLEEGSRNAKRMERMTIGVDVSAALKELEAFKAGFADIAKTAANIHFDLGMNMPTAAPPVSAVDTSALEELKTFFRNQADNLRKQAESMRLAGVSTGEYTEKLRTLHTAMREFDAATAKADAAMRLTVEADNRAAEAKRNLTQAEIELKRVSEQLNATHTGGTGDIMKLASREEELRGEVQQLSEAYKVAQAEADKLAAKLDVSAGKADEARARYAQLKASLDEIPAPAGKALKGIDTFSTGAKRAGTTATKLARGFNAVAFAGGAAVPGLTKLGSAVSMFAYSGPYVGAAVVGVGVLASAFTKLREQSDLEAKIIRENAERALKSAQTAKRFISESESDWNRLGELSSMTELSNVQNQEATAIITRLTETYGYLGIEIDKTTGKLKGYAEARAEATRQDREIQRLALENASKTTRIELEQTIRNAGTGKGVGPDGWLGTSLFDFKAGTRTIQGKGLSNFLEKTFQDGISLEKQIEKINARIAMFGDVSTKNSSLFLDSWGNIIEDIKKIDRTRTAVFEISPEDANREAKFLQEVYQKLTAANNAKRDLELFNTAGVEQYAQEAGRIAAQIAEAEKKFTQGDAGTFRMKTADEIYQGQKARIAAIEAERVTVEKKAAEDEKAILENGKKAGIYLKELELERLNLIEKTLTYEQRIAAEKERERKSLNSAIDAEQIRLNQFKSGFVSNSYGALLRAKNTDELAQDRAEEIKTLRAFIGGYNGGYGETLENQKEVVAAQLKLAQLQAEQLKYRDQVAAAGKQNEAARKGYVFDEKTGAVLRKKTETELQQIQAKEIEAARTRLRATEAGTLERAKAQAELDRLAIEEYNERKKMSASAALHEARAENTRLVRGIDARSTEALALEARTFRRDDNKETEILKKLESGQADFERNVVAELKQIVGEFISIHGKLQPL